MLVLPRFRYKTSTATTQGLKDRLSSADINSAQNRSVYSIYLKVATRKEPMFKTDLVEMSFLDDQPGVWDFSGKLCKGTKFFYEVDDYNYWMRNHWQFVVQVPDDWTKGNYTNVRPVIVPNRGVWAGLDQRTISFQRATIGRYRSKVYGKLAIADVKGEKTRLVLNKE